MGKQPSRKIPNEILLEVLLEHDDFSSFQKKGEDDWRPPDHEFNNSGFSLSSKGWFLHAEKGEQSQYNLSGEQGSLFDLVKKRGLLDEACRRSGMPTLNQQSNSAVDSSHSDNSIMAQQIWEKAEIASETARASIARYLTDVRKIPLENYEDLVALGWLRWDALNKCVIYPIIGSSDTKKVGKINRIFIDESGKKTSKKMLGKDGLISVVPPKAIDSQSDLQSTFLVCEGLENALSLRDRQTDTFLLSNGKSNLKHVPAFLPAKAEVRIISDHDANENPNQNGQTEAAKLRSELISQDYQCTALMPKEPKTDANDALQAGELQKWMKDLVEVPEITDDGLVIKQAIEMKSPAEVVCGATWRNELPITKSGTPWEEPEELFHEQEFNDYPIEELPATIRGAVKEVAEFVQSPIPLVAASALNTISTAVQGQYDVRRADGLEGPTSLFFLSIAESGERKTSSNKFNKLLWDYENAEREKLEPKTNEYEVIKEIWESKKTALMNQLKNCQQNNKPTREVEEDLHELKSEEPKPPTIPCLTYQDTTAEALLKGLSNYPVGTLTSDEAGGVLGGYSMKENSMKFVSDINQLWDGSPIRVTRKHADEIIVQGVRLSLGLMIQGETLRRVHLQSKGLLRGSGLLARFLISYPNSSIGTRHFKPPPEKAPNFKAFRNRLMRILAEKLPINHKCRLEPQMLEFSPEAQELWIRFHDEVEQELQIGKSMDDVRDIASKTADNAARIAASFHVFEGGESSKISEETLDSAKSIALWHLYEAQRFFRELETSKEISDAQKIDKWLLSKCRNQNVSHQLRREVQRSGPVRDKNDLNRALTDLHERSRCRFVKDGKKLRIEVNPKLLKV